MKHNSKVVPSNDGVSEKNIQFSPPPPFSSSHNHHHPNILEMKRKMCLVAFENISWNFFENQQYSQLSTVVEHFLQILRPIGSKKSPFLLEEVVVGGQNLLMPNSSSLLPSPPSFPQTSHFVHFLEGIESILLPLVRPQVEISSLFPLSFGELQVVSFLIAKMQAYGGQSGLAVTVFPKGIEFVLVLDAFFAEGRKLNPEFYLKNYFTSSEESLEKATKKILQQDLLTWEDIDLSLSLNSKGQFSHVIQNQLRSSFFGVTGSGKLNKRGVLSPLFLSSSPQVPEESGGFLTAALGDFMRLQHSRRLLLMRENSKGKKGGILIERK